MKAASAKRLVAQRSNNHKVLRRLNAEILTHQQNVREFLQANRQLIPEVSGDAKRRVLALLRDYAQEIPSCLNGLMPSPEAFAETKTRSVSNQEIAGAARAVRDDRVSQSLPICSLGCSY
ncbi:unnamed protein product [Polarella glacialis]|nr:unnamed protein product [Polarella glacialis]CAE8615754.1 unnamed protein product [Polarella glacialis]